MKHPAEIDKQLASQLLNQLKSWTCEHMLNGIVAALENPGQDVHHMVHVMCSRLVQAENPEP